MTIRNIVIGYMIFCVLVVGFGFILFCSDPDNVDYTKTEIRKTIEKSADDIVKSFNVLAKSEIDNPGTLDFFEFVDEKGYQYIRLEHNYEGYRWFYSAMNNDGGDRGVMMSIDYQNNPVFRMSTSRINDSGVLLVDDYGEVITMLIHKNGKVEHTPNLLTSEVSDIENFLKKDLFKDYWLKF
jgi:hypothetical protein